MRQKQSAKDTRIPHVDVQEISFIHYDTVDSTNSEAKRCAAKIALPAVLVADEQSAGRGRMGRSFFSPRDTGLYFSYLTDRLTPEHVVGLTAAAAVATARAIARVTGIETEIKWVNDLLLNGKKIAGILCERFMSEGRSFVVIGIGINLATTDFPDDLRHKAGSLGACESVREDLSLALTEELHALVSALPDRSFMEEYRTRSAVLGRGVRYTVNGKAYDAEAIAIDDGGGLLVRSEDGREHLLASGEISLAYEIR